ncbi:MAG: hypothetical protein QOD84_1231 [Acidobacteriaceae bacterium]
MVLSTVSCPSLLEVADPTRNLRSGPKNLPECESIFTASRVLVLAAACLFCAMPGWGSDASASTAAESPSTSISIKKNSKYDVDSIGQRSVGKGMNLYSMDKERALGEAMAAAIDRNTKFVADQEVFDYVNRLGRKLARSSDAEVPFTIRVIDSPDLNVFSLPGGFLYVAKGLIMELDNEAELAGLMAHEIAHVAARHTSKTATRRYAWNMAAIPLSQVAGPAGLGVRQIASLTFKKINRDSENEADLLGIEYQYTAGYDPQAFLDALEKLHAKEIQKLDAISKSLPAFGFIGKLPLHDRISRAFSNYPATEERIERVQGEIATLLPSRTEYITDSSEFQEVKARLGLADMPILHHHRAGDGVANPPILHRGAR